jgi:hypothetical protein
MRICFLLSVQEIKETRKFQTYHPVGETPPPLLNKEGSFI